MAADLVRDTLQAHLLRVVLQPTPDRMFLECLNNRAVLCSLWGVCGGRSQCSSGRSKTHSLASSSKSGTATVYPSYDPVGRPLQSQVQLNGHSYNFSYTYDLAGELTSETCPSGRAITTTYDGIGRPITVIGALGGVQTNYLGQVTYLPHGLPQIYQYGNNVWPVNSVNKVLQPYERYSTIGNDPNRWLLYTSHIWNGNETVGSLWEGYGSAVTWSNMTWRNTNLAYDGVNRLSAVADTSWSRTFSYDQYGNMSLTSNSNVPLNGLTPYNNGSYNPFNPANNRLLEANYDAAGNMSGVGALSFWYDAEGRQTQTYDSGSQTRVYYSYDGEGNRVQKAVSGGATTVYVHDAFGQLAAEYSSVGITPACQTCYLSYDPLGSVRLITDQSANVISRHDFLPFGEEIPNGSGGRSGNQFGAPSGLNQMFTGQERDPENSPPVDYFNMRQFHAVLGAFTSPDPANAGADISNPQSWNGYSYVWDNPLSAVDPTGLDRIDCGNGVMADACVTDSAPSPVDPWWWMQGSLNGPPRTSSGGGAAPTFSVTHTEKTPVQTASTVPAKNGNVFSCASEFAAKYSIAGGLQRFGIGTSGVGGFITNAMGGNAFSGATDLIQSFGSGEADFP